jgi:uncharacterized membrane protein
MTSRSSTRKQWLIPTGLILLVVVPLAAGAYRLTQLFGGAEVTPENARFFAAPAPVVIHILGAAVYTVLGAFQFVPGFRRRRPGWHRVAGRIVIPCGLAVALSGLWMTVFYSLPENDGVLLYFLRLGFGSAMALFIVLGLVAVQRRDFIAHQSWMIRGYAIGMGAGTQVLTTVPWVIAFGQPGEWPRAVLLAAGWLINVAVAERIIRRPPSARRRGTGGSRTVVSKQPLSDPGLRRAT